MIPKGYANGSKREPQINLKSSNGEPKGNQKDETGWKKDVPKESRKGSEKEETVSGIRVANPRTQLLLSDSPA